MRKVRRAIKSNSLGQVESSVPPFPAEHKMVGVLDGLLRCDSCHVSNIRTISLEAGEKLLKEL